MKIGTGTGDRKRGREKGANGWQSSIHDAEKRAGKRKVRGQTTKERRGRIEEEKATVGKALRPDSRVEDDHVKRGLGPLWT